MCRIHTAKTQPRPRPEHWSLVVGGLVAHPAIFSLEDLAEFIPATLSCALICTEAEGGMRAVENGTWRGVMLRDLVQIVQRRSDAEALHLFGTDDDAVLLSSETNNALLASSLNDAPLPLPRLIIPGVPACALPHYFNRIAWTSRPAAMISSIPPFADLDRYPETDMISGHVYTGEHGVSTIFLSVDGSPEMPVTILDGVTPYQYIRWSTYWPLPTDVPVQVNVRADNAKDSYSHGLKAALRTGKLFATPTQDKIVLRPTQRRLFA